MAPMWPLTTASLHATCMFPASPPCLLPSTCNNFKIKEILEVKCSRGKLYYLINWNGFGSEKRSWEPVENKGGPDLIRMFHHRLALKKRVHKGGGTVMSHSATHVALSVGTVPPVCSRAHAVPL